jgi:hypothetical protein
MEVVDDVWLFITGLLNGESRHNLSQINKYFRNLITKYHIYLIEQEQRRILSFITDVGSTTVSRFLDDFEKLRNEWKPPENNLLLHYVDYHYHLLIITLQMLKKIESYHVFFYFTNKLELSNGNLVKNLLYCFKYRQSLEQISKALILTAKFEYPFSSFKILKEYSSFPVHFIHNNFLMKWDFVAVPFRSRYLITLRYKSQILNSEYQPYLTMMTRFFSPTEVIIKSKSLLTEDQLNWYLGFPSEYVKRFAQTRFTKPPHFSNKIDIEDVICSPYLYEQVSFLFQKEGLPDTISNKLMSLDHPHKRFSELFNSQEWVMIKRAFSGKVLIENFDNLLDQQKLKSIYHLIKNWAYLFILFSSLNFSSMNLRQTFLIEMFSNLTIEQIDYLGDFVNSLSLSSGKEQFDSKIQSIFNQLKSLYERAKLEKITSDIYDIINQINKE